MLLVGQKPTRYDRNILQPFLYLSNRFIHASHLHEGQLQGQKCIKEPLQRNNILDAKYE